MHEAAAFGKEPVIRFLIENGVNIHSRTMLGRESALHLASSNGQEVSTKVLLKRACRVNDVNKQGGTFYFFRKGFYDFFISFYWTSRN